MNNINDIQSKDEALRVFKKIVIDIMDKYGKKAMVLDEVLKMEAMTRAKELITNNFREYITVSIMGGTRFNWLLFFENHLSPELKVKKNVLLKDGRRVAVLLYEPQLNIHTEKVTPKPETTTEKPVSPSPLREFIKAKEQTPTSNSYSSESIKETKYGSRNQSSSINTHLKKIIEELNKGLYEKERSIRLTLLAVLAGESTFMLGEPGTAKSLVARRISEAFEKPERADEIKFFDYLMNQFSTPEEIFGPVSIQELKNDRYIRKTEKYLPKAQFAFLDEIWKANPAIKNALLTILNEKIFRNGAQVEKVPLIGFMSASNELPAQDQGLEAIFDRFLVRILERPISDNSKFRAMISAGNTTTTVSTKLSKNDIQRILDGADSVEISEECYKIIEAIRKIITTKNEQITDENEKYLVSDRRWKKIAHLMRVSAYCNGRHKTDIMDATLIADCIWNTEEQENESCQIVAEAIKLYGVKCSADTDILKDSVSKFEQDIDSSFYKKVTGKKEKIVVISNRQYYEVKDSYNRTHYIACNSHDNYYAGKECYYIIKPQESQPSVAHLIYHKDTKKFEESFNTYTIQMEDTAPRLVKRNDLSEQVWEASADKFNKRAEEIESQINEAIKQVDNEIEEMKIKMNNLFADVEYFSEIILQEHIQVKTKLSGTLNELKKQMKRYEPADSIKGENVVVNIKGRYE